MAFRTARQTKEWNALAGSEVDMAAFGTFGAGVLSFNVSATVLRMLGEYVITARATLANADSARVTVAIGKIATDAAVLGATAFPDPEGEPGYPWLYWASHALHSVATDSANQSQASGISVRRSFDVRSMRKVKPNESLVMIIEAVDVAGTMPINFTSGLTRVLIGT